MYPPPFVIATPKYGINTVPMPTVAITRAWLAHDTYNYRHTRERMHGDRMKNSIFERGAQGCVTTCPPFMYSNTANRYPLSDGPFIVASTRSPVERVKITGRPG